MSAPELYLCSHVGFISINLHFIKIKVALHFQMLSLAMSTFYPEAVHTVMPEDISDEVGARYFTYFSFIEHKLKNEGNSVYFPCTITNVL